MRLPSYCFKSLESIYYFRMRVPKELQTILSRVELKKSLRTRDRMVAARRCRQHVQTAEKVFEELRLKLFRDDLVSGNEILKDVVLPEVQVGSVATTEEREPTSRRESRKIIKLRELIKLYIDEITSDRGRDTAKGIEKNLLRFMETVGDKQLDKYTVRDRQRYRDVLQRLPKCVNRTKYRDLPIRKIIKDELPADQRLSIKTVNMRLIEASTLFNWAVKHGLTDNNPFKNAVLKIKNTDEEERPSLSDAEIRKLIENLSEKQQSLSWCILISCFSGLRQSEVAALDRTDVVECDETWCLDINDRGDKRLKTRTLVE